MKKKEAVLQKQNSKQIKKYAPYSIVIILLVIVILTTYTVWDSKNNMWLNKTDESATKFTLAPPIQSTSTIIMTDASKLDPVFVAALYYPKTIDEIKTAIAVAKSKNKKISISGVRHSMGGQAFRTNALQLDMTKFDAVTYNNDQTVTAQSGAIWKQIQDELNKKGRAVAVMQDSNIFTVGGSVSVNAHGKDPHFGTLIETINYIKLINADAEEVMASRTENPELFKAVIGGYGLFGVITEVNLKTVDNSLYVFQMQEVKTEGLLTYFEEKAKDSDIELIEAHFSIDKDHLLTDSLVFSHRKIANNATLPLPEETYSLLRSKVFAYSKSNNYGKKLRWELEKNLTPLIESDTATRNQAMSAAVQFLASTDTQTTDILQEYYIPKDNFYIFLERYKQMITNKEINLTNVTLRKIDKDNESLMPYATEDMYAFVAYYTINRDKKDQEKLQLFTEELVNELISLKGTYYLPYGGYYTKEQLVAMYPAINNLPVLKQKFDSTQLFSNNWYEKYFGK